MFLSVVWFDVTVRHYKSIVSGFSNVYSQPWFIISCDCHGQIVFIIAVYKLPQTDCWFTKTQAVLTRPVPTSPYIFRVICFLIHRLTLTLCIHNSSPLPELLWLDCCASADALKDNKTADQRLLPAVFHIRSHLSLNLILTEKSDG